MVCRQLEAEGIEAFCPAIHIESNNPQAANIQASYVGYLFVRLNPDKQSLNAVELLPGTRELVKSEEGPVIVSPHVVEEIRTHAK